MRILIMHRNLFLSMTLFVIIFSACNSKKEKAHQYLTELNNIKKDVDLLDSSTYVSYMTTFLGSPNDSLYGKYDSPAFTRFIHDSDTKYEGLFVRLDTLPSYIEDTAAKNSLKSFIRYQQDGLESYYTKVLTLEKADTLLDTLYNARLRELEKAYFFEHYKLAKQYNINVITKN